MDFYEQLVHFYLTAIEKCAVIPQVEFCFPQPESLGLRIQISLQSISTTR
jgi:hypothetical protein